MGRRRRKEENRKEAGGTNLVPFGSFGNKHLEIRDVGDGEF